MPHVHLYSDESRSKGTGPFVVAGVAIDAYHQEIWRELLRMEEASGKLRRDWHSTRDFRTRRRYLEGALDIPHLRGQVFYRIFPGEPDNIWEATVHTLSAAVEKFAGDENCTLAHEGFTEGSRKKLKHAVRRSKGGGKIGVGTGNFGQNPMIRLADSLCGLLRAVHGGGPGHYGHLNQVGLWSWARKNDPPVRDGPGGIFGALRVIDPAAKN